MGKNQHVVPVYDLWGIKGEGNQKYTGLYDTQAEVIACTREISRNQCSELFIHGRDGRIRERDSHGNDPSHLKANWNWDAHCAHPLFFRYAPPPHGNGHSAHAGAPEGFQEACLRSSWQKR